MLLTGYILSIPVFADSALLIMNPLNKVLSSKAGVSFAGTTAALALGLTASHTMVPPTPGPIAAAGILGADLGSVMIWGLLISSISLVACYFFATKLASRINVPITLEAVTTQQEQPALWKSLQNSGIADTITSEFTGMELGLFLPFLLAACLKTTQGSSTVALVTTASIIAPLMPALGLNDPFMATMTVLSIGAGASVVSHVNDNLPE